MGILAALLLLAACSPAVHSLRRQVSDASFEFELQGDFGRLADDIPRAIERSHWGLLRLDSIPSPAATAPAQSSGQHSPQSLRAIALLPDGRTAAISAQPIGGKVYSIRLAVRVGPFGDEKLERAFAAKLAKVLQGKPKPKRGGTFALPETNNP